MAHKIFDARLKVAQQRERELASQIEQGKAQLRQALLREDHPAARSLQEALYKLGKQHELASELVSAVKETKPEADREVKEAVQLLEQNLPQVQALNNQLPGAYKRFLAELEKLVAEGQRIMKDYQQLVDLHYQACYLTELIESKKEILPHFRIDTEPLPRLAQQIRMLAQLPGLHLAGKWQERFNQLRREQNREAKRERREAEIAKGLNPVGRVVA